MKQNNFNDDFEDEEEPDPIIIEQPPEPRPTNKLTEGFGELGLDDSGEEELERDMPPKKYTGKLFFFCSVCNSTRQEILYLERDEMVCRCLSCGNFTSLIINPALIPKNKIRRTKNKSSVSYLG